MIPGLAELGALINELNGRLTLPRKTPAEAARETAAWLDSLPVSALARVDAAVREYSDYTAAFGVRDVPKLAKLPEAWAALGLASMSRCHSGKVNTWFAPATTCTRHRAA